MSKEAMADEHLNTILDRLEDTLNTYLAKCNNYQEVQNVLENEETISTGVLERILAVCVCDLKENTEHAASALAVISAVLAKLQPEKYTDTPLPNLLPSALAIVNLLKVISRMKVDTLSMLCFEVLQSFPDNTLVDMVASHTAEVIEMIDICACKHIDGKEQFIKIIDLVALKLLVKLFKILPHATKEEFVKQGLNVWFSNIMPSIIAFTKAASPDVITCIEMLELLTDSLMHIDYEDNPHWKIMLECIYNPQKYPDITKALLQCKSDNWYRLWIIFIRLLKRQVTKVSNSSGSPINSMLPVVELAFKLDPKSRCQAFQCWNVLIDNFASEFNDSPAHVLKRMKLLIVPLKSSNAKVEQIACAKLNTWWHLMRRFHSKMDSFTDMILIPFLYFCFGKEHASGRVLFSPGQFSDDLKKQCLQALVEIAGHVDCEGCVTLPKLESKLISAKILVDHWNDWVHSLKNAIIIAAIDYDTVSKRQVTCLWKSFVMTIGEMQENNIRKDLFNELLATITHLRQSYAMNDKLADITFNVLIGSLLEDNNKIRPLLKTRGEGMSPIQTILNIITNPSFNNFFSRNDSKELVTKLKPLTNLIMDGSLAAPDDIIKWLFKAMLGNDTTLMLWAALSESLCESDHDTTTQNMFNMLLWPLKFLSEYSNERSSIAWNHWLTLYNLMHHKLSNTSINHNISKILSTPQIQNHQTSWEFPLCAILAVLKSKLLQDESKGCEQLTKQSLLKILMEINGYQCIEKVLPILFDTVTLMADKVVKFLNVSLAIYTIDIVKIVLKLMTQIFKQNDNAHAALIFTENLMKLLESMFKIVDYSFLKQKIVDELIECLSLTDKNSSLHYNILSLLKSFLMGNNKLEQTLYMKTKAAIDADNGEMDYSTIEIVDNALCTKSVAAIVSSNIDYNIDNLQNNDVGQDSVKSTFTTPNDKGLRKKFVNKDASIVNTVVENGEEFVVVKSHWKFNPRKLTENQKEKLKRKREDIPALYQDLSQSQDEFKLAAWKSNDSQETTTTSSKSTSKSNDMDASVILQNIPSSDVVPNIMENILSHATRDIQLNENTISDKPNKQPQLILVKDPKSPRLALKDRVFRNVRNLIEKSTLQQEDKLKSENINLTLNENVPKTPPSKTNTTSYLINSAPSKITCERPSRIIKIPKKFEDSELNVFKKRRRSQNDSPLPDLEILAKPVEESNLQMKPNNSERMVMHKRRRSQNNSPQPDFKIPNKPVEESKMQTKSNNSELAVLKKRRRSENGSPLPDFDKPVEESNVQTIPNNSEPVVLEKSCRSQNSSPQPNSEIHDKPVEEQNVITKLNNLEDILHNSSLQPNLENADKPIEDTNLPTKANKEDARHLKIMNDNSYPVVNNFVPHLQCTTLGNNTTSDKKMPDTQIEHSESNQIEEYKNINQEKGHDKVDTNMNSAENSILIEGNEILENTNTNEDVTEDVLTPKLKKIPVPNKDQLSTANIEDVLTHNKKYTETPKPKNKETIEQKSTVKKKRSRIEQQLLIDMVEGHPFLQVKSEKRVPKKNEINISSGIRTRRSLAEKLSRSPLEIKSDKKLRKKDKSSNDSTSVTVSESQENLSQSSEDFPMSEDIIESSQDSSITTVSMKSSKHILKKVPLNKLDNIKEIDKNFTSTQHLLDEFNNDIEPLNKTLSDQDSREDIELSKNKTRDEDDTKINFTENMDTEPIEVKCSSGEIIIVNNESPIVINTEDTCIELDTQEIAEADTQPLDAENETTLPVENNGTDSSLIRLTSVTNEMAKAEDGTNIPASSECLELSATVNTESAGSCSPLTDEFQRKKDFLNDTIEISPIKAMSPVRDKKSPSPETSSDYVVIKLTSPVQSNGEPFDKCDSPEIFTEDKVSPDKRDQSPPRVVVSVQNTSPSSSLSLRKNRPQVRQNGRAAHMLGLCAPDQLQAIMNSERSVDSDESKKSGNLITPARRNLRILYNSVGENTEHQKSENDNNDNFLKFKKCVPTADCSPSVPILKRKLADVVDEATISPASKRKRVSFHDPPVSTTIAVQKYLEPGVRSPQSSAFKRLDKQMRANLKSPKKLENVFKLDTVLTKAVESFSEEAIISIDDTVSSIDQTPAVEVVKTSDLNDTDPICSDLLDCSDPIDNIAGELSSPAMKALFIKELEGTVKTIGNLAKMTELEVNRLRIKAPKVKVAKKILINYASKKAKAHSELNNIEDEFKLCVADTVSESQQTASVEVQTNPVFTKSCDMQTVAVPVMLAHTQTDIVPTSHNVVQTDESGNKSTYDVIATCLLEKPDFIDQLSKQLGESSIQQIADNLTLNASVDLLLKKMTTSDTMNVLHQVLNKQIAVDSLKEQCGNKKLSLLQAYLCQMFNSNDLILFCSQLLQKIHDKHV